MSKVNVRFVRIDQLLDTGGVVFEVNDMYVSVFLVKAAEDNWMIADDSDSQISVLHPKVQKHLIDIADKFVKLLNESSKDITL